jgi:hypothetical protein
MVEERSGETSGEGPWLTIAAAARQLKVTPRAIRSRIARGTIEWKAAGNTGKLVRVPPGEAAGPAPGETSGEAWEVAILREELSEARGQVESLQAKLDASEAVRKAQVFAAEAVAEARVEALRELAGRLTSELAEARAQIAEANRPWWRRLIG